VNGITDKRLKSGTVAAKEEALVGKSSFTAAVLATIALGGPSALGAALPQSSPWQPLTQNIDFCQVMQLLTDGSVMVYGSRFVPDSSGSYVNMKFASHDALPQGYLPGSMAMAVLPDGRAIYEGGECNPCTQTNNFTNLGAIYDPVAHSWSMVSPPSGWSTIGGAPSVVLPDGRFMIGRADPSGTTTQAILDATTLTWTATGAGKADANMEEGWTLLPDGSVLAIDSNKRTNPTSSEKYDPATGTWSSAGTTVVQLADTAEIGPQVLRPDGTVIVFGSLAAGKVDHTAVYNTTSGTWSAGPDIPSIGGVPYTMIDVPAAVLPNGNVLFPASPDKYASPVHFFEFDGQNITQVPDPSNAALGSATYTGMLVLPTGQVLVGFCNGLTGAGRAQTYTSGGSANSAWAPTISSVPATLVTGATYQLAGTQLNGLTEAAYFGDDARNASNYPLVRITNNATGHVFYARTFGHSTMSVAPNTASSTNFTLPPSGKIETGASSVVVVANGIASQPVAVTVVSGTNYTLSVSVIGSPGGRVTSSPSGIDCGATCAATFAAGAQVTLTASPAAAWGLAGWSGACSGIASSCAVALGGNESVAAKFTTLFSAEASPSPGAPELPPPLIAPIPQ
jgi:hypothetical protein